MRRSPRIAALGGGTGLASLLRGLKREPLNLTAIVTVADDGGSSGRLRRELGVLPPGDIRNCLVALADDESLLGTLFQHRFSDGDLSGHSFGNLFLAALTEVTGNFDLAIQECSRVLKIRGRVLPSTLESISLWAERMAGGAPVNGETAIGEGEGPCRRVWLEPEPAGPRAGGGGDRGGRPGAPGAGEPLHERPPAPGGAGDRVGRPRRPRAAGLHLQRDDPARRDRRLRRRGPPRARARDGPRRRGHDPGPRGPARPALGGRSTPPRASIRSRTTRGASRRSACGWWPPTWRTAAGWCGTRRRPSRGLWWRWSRKRR